MNIAVVGAGIIGVTTAVAIQEAFPEYSLTIFADTWSPETTGDGSAGLWGPFSLGPDTPEADVRRWGGITHRWFQDFWKSGLAPDTGVALVPVNRVTSKDGWVMEGWISEVYGAQQMTDRQIGRWNKEHNKNYKNGLHFVTYIAEPTKLIPWLMIRYRLAGGKTQNKKICNLDDLKEAGYDVVINCTGIGARKLVDDLSLRPVRGHVIRVKAPWIASVFIEEDNPGNYIIPNLDTVVLGGTGQLDDYDLSPRKSDEKFIREGCQNVFPALEKSSEFIKNWVGLRPVRPRVRLEQEYKCSDTDGKEYLVIHNYGHGGCGVTICWGCALDVVQILKNAIDKCDKNSL